MKRLTTRSLIATATSASLVAAAAAAPFAIADQPSTSPRGPKTTTTATSSTATTTTTTPATPSAAERRAGYGVRCKGLSKKHVAGGKGTPFSQCVTALAKIDRGVTRSPSEACKALSRKHAEGRKGTPYSQCVTAAAQQRKVTEQAAS